MFRFCWRERRKEKEERSQYGPMVTNSYSLTACPVKKNVQRMSFSLAHFNVAEHHPHCDFSSKNVASKRKKKKGKKKKGKEKKEKKKKKSK